MSLSRSVSFAVTALLVSTCQPSAVQPGPPSSPTSTATQAASPSPAAAKTKALVLASSAAYTAPDLLLYDPSTNTALTLLRSKPVEAPRFASAGRISYLLDHKLITQDVGSPRSDIVNEVGGLVTYAWAPGGSVVYLMDGMGGDELTIGWGSAAKTLASWNLRGGSSPPDAMHQFEVEFSHDGRYFFVIDTLAAGPAPSPETRRLQVRRATGELAFAPPDTKSFPSATQPLWSALTNVLYFQEPDGIHSWDADSGTESLMIPGLHWYQPSASPGGQAVAYSTLDAAKIPSVEIFDLEHRVLTSSRRLQWGPVFVTADMLLYREQSPCPQASCGSINAASTGRVLADQLSTGKTIDLPFGKMVIAPNGVGAFQGDSAAAVWNG